MSPSPKKIRAMALKHVRLRTPIDVRNKELAEVMWGIRSHSFGEEVREAYELAYEEACLLQTKRCAFCQP